LSPHLGAHRGDPSQPRSRFELDGWQKPRSRVLGRRRCIPAMRHDTLEASKPAPFATSPGVYLARKASSCKSSVTGAVRDSNPLQNLRTRPEFFDEAAQIPAHRRRKIRRSEERRRLARNRTARRKSWRVVELC